IRSCNINMLLAPSIFFCYVTATTEIHTLSLHDALPISYAELAARARRLATLLENEGVEPGTVVGVGGTRSADVIDAFLAIELIGALYVPADETWPAGRVRDVLDQAGASVLIAAEDAGALAEGAAEAGCRIVPFAAADGLDPWPGEPRLDSLD